jgi:arylsulfate sulfotransferase
LPLSIALTPIRWIALLFLVSMAARLEASISVTLASSPASPQPVGTVITWTATVQDTAPGTHEYQFSVGPANGQLAIVQDFSLAKTLPWAFSQTEGTYQVRVVVQNTSNQTSAQAAANFVVTSLRLNGLDAVNPTANPLVALFSGPPCDIHNTVRVRFNQVGSSVSQTTNAIPCSPTNTANFYIAGMYPNSQYQMHHETVSPSGMIVQTGRTLTFTTGSLPTTLEFPTNTVPIPAGPPSSITAPILLHGYLPTAGSLPLVQSATDLSGNVLWYYPHPVGQLTRTEVGGKMFVLISHQTNLYNNVLQEIDLAGNITLATNVHRINEQLAQMTDPFTGMPRRPVNQFDHEIRRLSNGNIAVKASSEMLVTNKAQCGTDGSGNPKTCDVLGAQLLILNPNLQIIWAWDSFDFLDINRPANLREVCHQGDSGCPVIFLAATANDWLHANSIQLTEDGSLLFSLRDQDWIIKINYANGTGDGSVLWRMGYQGDFTLNDPPSSPLCTTPNQQQIYAWFSHQHDANFEYGGQSVLTLFDNGNLRITRCDTGGSSRGYVLTVDESNRTVTPILIQDLGSYSVGLGTAEVIPGSSNYHFNNGFIQPGPFTRSQEITPEGNAAFEMDSEDILTYRSYRMQDLYTPAPPL